MKDDESDQTASIMTPAKLAQLRMKPAVPAASPAAYLDQLAADAGSGHVRRLIDLREQLEAQARERTQDAGIVAALAALADEHDKLDFELLQPKGWLARATGKGREETAAFVAQFERIESAIEDLRDEARDLQRRDQAQTSASARTLGELEAEARALDRIVDQQTRWLHDMRQQLKSRRLSGPDAAGEKAIEQDQARCDMLVARIKQLGGARSAAQHAQDRITMTAGKRGHALGSLQQTLSTEIEAWLAGLRALAAQLAEGPPAAEAADRARQAHEALGARLKQLKRDYGQVQFYENDLVDELGGLEPPLMAAA